jgi:CDP-glucose 4,6-dehydratase
MHRRKPCDTERYAPVDLEVFVRKFAISLFLLAHLRSMMFESIYKDRRVFVTGHTGFKGSWLCMWLEKLGASVCGYSLAPSTDPSHFEMLNLAGESIIADIRDYSRLEKAIHNHQPEVVFHLAAQPSVLVSYEDPVETFSTNVAGTASLLDVIRRASFVKAAVVVTTDKCYENKEWLYAYRESDRLGGHDPYSASKACAEMVVESFRKSFFSAASDGSADTLIASARAGNVIGGGDWTADRLLPDVMRAAASGVDAGIRNPESSRPWQHVLEPLSGYLRLGQRLLGQDSHFAGAWNFGPAPGSNLTTGEIVKLAGQYWPAVSYKTAKVANAPHEAGLLMVDSTKANRLLDWFPVWDINTTIEKTVSWYREYYDEGGRVSTEQQIDAYCDDALVAGVAWAKK